jgi:hypothetical protein
MPPNVHVVAVCALAYLFVSLDGSAGTHTPAAVGGASQSLIQQIMPPAANIESFQRYFSSWILSTFTPLSRLEHHDLHRALAFLGTTPPTRKACGTKHLEHLYSTALAETIKQIKIAGEVQVTMDGWKKRAAEHGTPLVTVVVLLPDGGSLFWKVSSLQASHAFPLLCNGHNCVLIPTRCSLRR